MIMHYINSKILYQCIEIKVVYYHFKKRVTLAEVSYSVINITSTIILLNKYINKIDIFIVNLY